MRVTWVCFKSVCVVMGAVLGVVFAIRMWVEDDDR